jgi:hypothetical protein
VTRIGRLRLRSALGLLRAPHAPRGGISILVMQPHGRLMCYPTRAPLWRIILPSGRGQSTVLSSAVLQSAVLQSAAPPIGGAPISGAPVGGAPIGGAPTSSARTDLLGNTLLEHRAEGLSGLRNLDALRLPVAGRTLLTDHVPLALRLFQHLGAPRPCVRGRVPLAFKAAPGARKLRRGCLR